MTVNSDYASVLKSVNEAEQTYLAQKEKTKLKVDERKDYDQTVRACIHSLRLKLHRALEDPQHAQTIGDVAKAGLLELKTFDAAFWHKRHVAEFAKINAATQEPLSFSQMLQPTEGKKDQASIVCLTTTLGAVAGMVGGALKEMRNPRLNRAEDNLLEAKEKMRRANEAVQRMQNAELPPNPRHLGAAKNIQEGRKAVLEQARHLRDAALEIAGERAVKRSLAWGLLGGGAGFIIGGMLAGDEAH